MRTGIVSVLVTLFAGAGYAALPVGQAVAATKPDPQTTNVPYLAWIGEQIKMQKCWAADVSPAGMTATLLVEDWSGNPTFPPQIEGNTIAVTRPTAGELCAKGDAIALHPGMARIEIDVTDRSNTPVLKHQFLAGWMTLNTPTLTELGASSFAASAQANAARTLGDPAGDGHFVAGSKYGLLSVKVSGSMPMGNGWDTLLGQSSVTLPGDWALLAQKLATDSNPGDANPAMRWDIHDDESDFAGHVPSSGCLPPFTQTTIDAVDNCPFGDPSAPTVGGPMGPFSSVFGLSSPTTVGPFDPLRPNDTLLSNGSLDAGDAPMPAARIDVSIAQNSGGRTDISGAGFLAPANKAVSYSRDFTGAPTSFNLYAPFYDAYIPATTAGEPSSGIDGPAAGNDFTGFLTSGLYRFWDFAYTFKTNAGGATSCLRSSADPQADSPIKNPGDYYQLPSGAASVAVYTDEHGEGQVQYVPGLGYYFNSLLNSGAAIPNANGGCDLQDVGLLGTADITAVARYPYKPVDSPDMTSNTVHKDVRSLWSKTLTVFPKGTGTANANARIVVAHAQDIDGRPFSGETVCFASDAEGMSWFNGTAGGINLGGTSLGTDPKGGGRLCVVTDANGNAAVEVFESHPVHVNVIADFTNEGILRNVDADFTTPPPTPSPSPSPSPAPAPKKTPAPVVSTHSPTPSQIQAIMPVVSGVTLPTSPTHQAHLTKARLIRRLHGKHYVLVHVASSSRTARIRLRETRSVTVVHQVNGSMRVTHIKRTTTVTRTVGTGRDVKILVPSNVVKVSVVLIG